MNESLYEEPHCDWRWGFFRLDWVARFLIKEIQNAEIAKDFEIQSAEFAEDEGSELQSSQRLAEVAGGIEDAVLFGTNSSGLGEIGCA